MIEREKRVATTSELANLRTEWASKRTRMANERTMIAWLRTGLAMTGFGAVVPRLLTNIEPAWLVNLIAALFVFAGVVTVVVGIRTYRETMEVYAESEQGLTWWVVAILAGAIQLGAIAILILFILE